MILKTSTLFAGLLLSLSFGAAGDAEPSDALMGEELRVIQKNNVVINTDDIAYYLANALMPEVWESGLSRPNAIRQVVENLYLLRRAEQESLALGLLDAEYTTWQGRNMETRAAAEAWVSNYTSEKYQGIDWDALTREHFLANPDEYSAGVEVNVDHILVSTEERPYAEVVTRVAELQNRIWDGEDFEVLAKEFSDDPSASQNSGHLGFITKGQTHPAFEKAAFSMSQIGEISDPIVTVFGVHFIKYNGRRDGRSANYDQIKHLIKRDLEKKLKATLKDGAYIGFKRELLNDIPTINEDALRPIILEKLSRLRP